MVHGHDFKPPLLLLSWDDGGEAEEKDEQYKGGETFDSCHGDLF
jgi:hypothetical protein